MTEEQETRFGPFLLGLPLQTRRRVELRRATIVLADGTFLPVALRRTRTHDDGMHDKFVAAAARYAVMHHPNIARVIDFGAIDRKSYIATEWIDGRDLLRVLGRCAQKRVGFPTDVALLITKRLLDALDYGYGLRAPNGDALAILHGDVAHSNVLLTAGGDISLTDFGMRLGSTRRRTLTGVNHTANKSFSCYLAPEVLRDEPADHRSDLFSVGVLLYELVTGRLLLKSPDEDELFDIIRSGTYTVPLERHRSDLHPKLAKIIHRALANDPNQRFQSATEFSAAIDAVLDDVNAEIQPKFLVELMRRLFTSHEPGANESP